MKVAIIGAGIGGLATAGLLAAKGHEVHVFEKNEHVGGKMNIVQRDGYRFDTGPSLFTMPNILQKMYIKLGTKLEDELTLSPSLLFVAIFIKMGQFLIVRRILIKHSNIYEVLPLKMKLHISTF